MKFSKSFTVCLSFVALTMYDIATFDDGLIDSMFDIKLSLSTTSFVNQTLPDKVYQKLPGPGAPGVRACFPIFDTS